MSVGRWWWWDLKILDNLLIHPGTAEVVNIPSHNANKPVV